MTAKVEIGKLKTRRSALGFDLAATLTFALLLCLGFSLLGCNEQQTATPSQQVSMPPETRKAELINLLERKFENPDGHFRLAQMYHGEGLWTKAEYHYNVALGFDPAHADAKASMVKLFLDSGDSAQSKTNADEYMIKASNSATQSLRLAVAFHKQQLDEYALDSYQQAFSLAPGSAEVNKQMGLYYLDKGDKVLAKEYLIRSFNLDSKQPDVAGELGRLGVEVRIPGQADKPPGLSSEPPQL